MFSEGQAASQRQHHNPGVRAGFKLQLRHSTNPEKLIAQVNTWFQETGLEACSVGRTNLGAKDLPKLCNPLRPQLLTLETVLRNLSATVLVHIKCPKSWLSLLHLLLADHLHFQQGE